jgi:hypothetical protein
MGEAQLVQIYLMKSGALVVCSAAIRQQPPQVKDKK